MKKIFNLFYQILCYNLLTLSWNRFCVLFLSFEILINLHNFLLRNLYFYLRKNSFLNRLLKVVVFQWFGFTFGVIKYQTFWFLVTQTIFEFLNRFDIQSSLFVFWFSFHFEGLSFNFRKKQTLFDFWTFRRNWFLSFYVKIIGVLVSLFFGWFFCIWLTCHFTNLRSYLQVSWVFWAQWWRNYVIPYLESAFSWILFYLRHFEKSAM